MKRHTLIKPARMVGNFFILLVSLLIFFPNISLAVVARLTDDSYTSGFNATARNANYGSLNTLKLQGPNTGVSRVFI